MTSLKKKKAASKRSGKAAKNKKKSEKKDVQPSLQITHYAISADRDLFENVFEEIKGLRVYNVGQGDCFGVLNQDEKVGLFIDYGGLARHPDQNDYDRIRKRISVRETGRDAIIVLTHWDKDHYYSATKNSEAWNCRWIVPRQKVSPQATVFASKLKDAECWPEKGLEDSPIRFRAGKDFVEIRKCGPWRPTFSEDRNLTGLAVFLVQSDNGTDQQVMFLPGDCPFDRVPNRPSTPIRALVAYHHGSHAHWREATKNAVRDPSKPHCLVYSYAPHKQYKHPDRKNYKSLWDAQAGNQIKLSPDLVSTPLLDKSDNRYDIFWKPA